MTLTTAATVLQHGNFSRHRLQQVLLVSYAAVWAVLAVSPVDRKDWFLENLGCYHSDGHDPHLPTIFLLRRLVYPGRALHDPTRHRGALHVCEGAVRVLDEGRLRSQPKPFRSHRAFRLWLAAGVSGLRAISTSGENSERMGLVHGSDYHHCGEWIIRSDRILGGPTRQSRTRRRLSRHARRSVGRPKGYDHGDHRCAAHRWAHFCSYTL